VFVDNAVEALHVPIRTGFRHRDGCKEAAPPQQWWKRDEHSLTARPWTTPGVLPTIAHHQPY